MYLTLEIRITELRFKNYRIRTNSVHFRAFCSMVVGETYTILPGDKLVYNGSFKL